MAAPTAGDGVSVLPATRKSVKGWVLALDALAGHGGFGVTAFSSPRGR